MNSDNAKDFSYEDRLQEECDKLGYPYYLFKLTGGYTTFEDGIRRFHNKDDKKGFEVGAILLLFVVLLHEKIVGWTLFLFLKEQMQL